ncbi:ATP-dependent helicase [Bacillus benzoevorans]|uniref:DNA 3'-5' helicase n=1 Tax=Bacillus benzoevorans TaxID=1456 RepID=A0A7X0HQA6_9BACI|nr:ATP-dependent helicase [Bacillus benzoevorans]MBB6443571.1 DNA helicase-2/ATP-dependent DNA helicase PcrA [Bacillus benzoevorans]
MKTAKKGNEWIHLDKLDRSSYQRLHDDGKKGLLTCPVCSEQVRFILGISSAPHFQHVKSRDRICSDPEIELSKPSTENIKRDINGFHLPQSRVITASRQEVNHFRATQSISQLPPYTARENRINTQNSSYIEALQKADVYLDEKQAKAVAHPNGAMLVIAGAGSGKTRVLTARTAFLIAEQKIEPNRIMLVTFTAKAANEMKARLLDYPYMTAAQIKRLVTGTFHSIFFRILIHHNPLKWDGRKLLNKEWMRGQILKDAGKELGLDDKEFAYDAALQQIGFWKNSLMTPVQIKPESDWEEKTALLFKRYEEHKAAHDLFDFDDMLTGCIALFQEQPELLEHYQKRFDHFLIDEFQDVNKVQYELIKLLSARSKNVCAVGDDDQSIYSFRGSDPRYLLDFEKDFPQADVIILDENYRSSHKIVATANKIITQNKKRRPKQMHAQFNSEQVPIFFFPDNEEEEATMIITDIGEKITLGAEPEDFAILFRTNTASRAVFERLAHSSLPFKIEQDIESFYERFIVRSMLSFLRLALNEEDQTAITSILPALFVKQSLLRDLKADSILNDCTLLESLSKTKTGFSFQERKLKKLLPVIRSLSKLSPFSAIEKVDKELGFQEFLKKRGNEGNRWEKGSDDIRDLKVAATNFASIQDFLEHADHMTAMNKEMKLQSKQRKNAVTLSTIHRAKGLEYKTVYIIGTVDGSIPHDFALESFRSGSNEPLEEERRLLYVAVTRAMEELFISIPEHWRGKKSRKSRFLTDIR